MVLNEEKRKMKQRSLFGGIVKNNTKSYCIYKNPDTDFESVVVLFVVKKKSSKQNKELVAQAHKFWKENKTKEKKIKEFIHSMFKDVISSPLILDYPNILIYKERKGRGSICIFSVLDIIFDLEVFEFF